MSNDTLAINYADAVNKNLEEIWANIDGADKAHDWSGHDDAIQILDELPLELINRRGSLYAVVITLGGPDARIVWDAAYGWQSAELIVQWGGEKVARTGEAIERTAEYFYFGMAESAYDQGEE